jgi:hypothetical protein
MRASWARAATSVTETSTVGLSRTAGTATSETTLSLTATIGTIRDLSMRRRELIMHTLATGPLSSNNDRPRNNNALSVSKAVGPVSKGKRSHMAGSRSRYSPGLTLAFS